MFQKINKYTESINLKLIDLMPDNLKKDPVSFQKGLAVLYLHIFFTFTFTSIIIFIHITQLFSYFESHIAFVWNICLFYYFLKKGNTTISSNAMSFVAFATLLPTIPTTGGIYSDNILWLFLAPLLSLLFNNRRWAIFWFLAWVSVVFYYYHFTNPSQFTFILTAGKDYWVFSILWLAFICVGLFIISEYCQVVVMRIWKNKEESLTEKNTALEDAENRLKEINQELENFAFAASHDMKEPLRMIHNYTQLIKRRLNGQLDENTTEFMFFITDAVQRMQVLIDELLAYSRLGKNTAENKIIDLNNTLYLVVFNLSERIKENGATITVEHLPFVEANSSEMTQLFQNFLANAIKFRKKDERPEIVIRVEATDDNKYLFKITDNGIGIKAEYAKTVFEMFKKLHTRQEYEGTGIGLATCRKIIFNHGGDIWLESTEGVDTTFFFTFPAVAENVVA